MKPIYKDLGKVCVTPEGFWDNNKTYEKLSIVTNELNGKSYISRKDVTIGIDINNTEYWQPIGSSGYKNNNIIIISENEYNKPKIHTLDSAIKSIVAEDRCPGMIIGFYGIDYADINKDDTWYLYQFISNTVDDWEDVNCWKSVYDNVNKFKGYFTTEDALINAYPFPILGDFAYVGESLENSILYHCSTKGVWRNTNQPAFEYTEYVGNIYKENDTHRLYNRIHVPKKLSGDINILTQDMISMPYTHYIFQYNHLFGATITVPEKCILDFTQGGALYRGGTFICNNTVIMAPFKEDLGGVTFSGTYKFFGE